MRSTERLSLAGLALLLIQVLGAGESVLALGRGLGPPPLGEAGAAPPRRLPADADAPSPPEQQLAPPPVQVVCPDGPALSAAEVMALAIAAADALDAPAMTVAVVDRGGEVLALYRKQAGLGTAAADHAVGLARTGAFFSNDQAPLSSRTVRFLSGIHFPPGIARTPNAALYGIENTNRGCDLSIPGLTVPHARSSNNQLCDSQHSSGCGTGPVTGKVDPLDSLPGAVDPGGLPIFRGRTLIGGIGVDGAPPAAAEFAALTALATVGCAPATGCLPDPERPGVVFIDGVRLPFVEQRRRPAGTAPEPTPGGGFFESGPADGSCVPEGYLYGPVAGTRLTQPEVDHIIQQAVATASRTRAVIRLPIGSRARMVIAVGDLDGTILALYRMRDATVFSIDVAVAKARNVVYWSSPAAGMAAALGIDLPGVPQGTAVTNRTVSFGAQPLYPPGIDGSGPGPFFPLYLYDSAHPCSLGHLPPGPNQNGVVFFPGSIPLYAGGTLAGGLGVSGDGVEQDDYVSWGGAAGFRPDPAIWADRRFIDGVRLPFLKFPRNPER